MGVRRFAALAHEAGLLPDGMIELYGPPARLQRRDVDALLLRAVEGGALGTDEVEALWQEAPLSDLAAAAHLVRTEVVPGGEVGFRTEPAASNEVIRASDADLISRLLGLKGRCSEVELVSGTASGTEHLRLVAVARLVLRHARLVVPARSEGMGAMQVALHAGANHAGTVGETWIPSIERQIRDAGFEPKREGHTTA
jgi:2-iminoacetate synthase ThiH